MKDPLSIAWAAAFVKLLVHLVWNRGYGYFRDELYYIACGEHLDWGYVDHAPLVAVYAKISRLLLGDSLSAIRLLPALAGSGKILLTGLIVREMGGGPFAVFLACASVLVAPIYLGIDNFLSMNAFEPVFWMGCVYLVMRAIRHDNPRIWLSIGVVAGIGLQNKHSMLFFCAALVAGLLFAPQRRLLWNRWLWIGGAVALLLFLPNLVWQAVNGFPTLEALRNVQAIGKNVTLNPIEFAGQQLLVLSPLTALVWIPGLWFCLRTDPRWRWIAWTYLALLVLMIALKGKNYYLVPAYPMLFAAGALFWERRVGRSAVAAVICAGGVVFAPLALPVLPVERFEAYQARVGLAPPKTEVAHIGPLPQHLGDMLGWPEMVETVARVYHALPPAERAVAGILTSNYGEAGAIDFLGAKHGLPKAISGNQNYFRWGPRGFTGEVLILLNWPRSSADRYCRIVEEGPWIRHPWAMPYERFQILICRGLHPPLAGLWPRLKHWN